MNDRIFIDSNIILYAFSKTEIEKSKIANELIFSKSQANISKQVINEVINILGKKYYLSTDEIKNVVLELDDTFNVLDFSLNTQIEALEIKEKYQLQYYDSLIIATALEYNCSILYSEDMQHNQIIDEKLKITNPFYSLNR